MKSSVLKKFRSEARQSRNIMTKQDFLAKNKKYESLKESNLLIQLEKIEEEEKINRIKRVLNFKQHRTLMVNFLGSLEIEELNYAILTNPLASLTFETNTNSIFEKLLLNTFGEDVNKFIKDKEYKFNLGKLTMVLFKTQFNQDVKELYPNLFYTSATGIQKLDKPKIIKLKESKNPFEDSFKFLSTNPTNYNLLEDGFRNINI